MKNTSEYRIIILGIHSNEDDNLIVKLDTPTVEFVLLCQVPKLAPHPLVQLK